MEKTREPQPAQRSASRDERLNPVIRVLIVLTVLVNVVYLGVLLLPGDPASTLVETVLSITAQWLAVGVFWLVAVRTKFGMPEVVLAAAGITFNAAGDTFYTLAANSSGELPSPSLADLGYLLYYPLTMAALVVLVLRQSRSSVRPVLFDGAVASLGAAAVLAVILGPIFTDATSGASLLNGAIAALYPLFDLLLITAVVAIFASPVLRIGPRWQFLVIGFLLFTGADIAYAFLTYEGAYTTGIPLDAVWTAAVASTAIWVEGVTRLSPESRPAVSASRMLPVPALGVLAGLGVLLVATQIDVPTVALVLAAATIVLAALTVMSRHATLAGLLRGQEDLVRQLQELDRSKSDLIHTMSHEMRTPLTSILGYLDLVMDDDEAFSQETKTRLRVVERNARRLQDLARNMLLLARFQSGEAVPVIVSIDLDRMLRRVEESLRPLADSRDVDVEITGDTDASVEGDELQLEQALTNVIENAVKFTPACGRVQVDVASVGRRDVVIDVTDTGMGIPEEDVPHVFDRFFRAANAQHQAVQGTGLGLAIVREIVHAHHGDVSVSSVLAQGTALRITLPAHRNGAGLD
ncbi:HAMP domain-containing sensor histidine kinase [Planococcus sp. APC 4015]|nr:HAMP domain-containing sensor histidine kinase [Planococcus sp. APC 4015]